MSADSEARQLVRDVLTLSRPKTVRELLAAARSKDPGVSEKRVLEALDSLREDGGIGLSPPRFEGFGRFFSSPTWNSSFWVVLVIVAVSGLLYLLAGGFPWSLLQIVPGVLLVFYFPGHSFLKVLFSRENVQSLERIVLEIGTSIVLIFLLGLLLNFSGLGLFSAPALSSLVVLNLLMALWASYHDYAAHVD